MFGRIFRLLLISGSLALAIGGGTALPAQAQSADGMALGDSCTSCHGVDGHSQGSVPSIGGVDKATLLSALTAFKAGKGDPTIMNRVVRGYTDAELAALADYFSSVKSK
jgi:sulfide dehydrogenase cytochrome subunit